jgi:hypothetical protein
MKPVAPALLSDDAAEQPSLQSEIGRVCDEKASEVRATVPSPPSEEALRAATPFPPPPPLEETADDETPLVAAVTTPAPPPTSAIRKRPGGAQESDDEASPEAPRTTIPGPPRVPRITGT